MRAFIGIVAAMIWAPLSLAQTLLSQAPYSSPQFLKMTDVNGFVRVLELDWDGGLFRMIPPMVLEPTFRKQAFLNILRIRLSSGPLVKLVSSVVL